MSEPMVPDTHEYVTTREWLAHQRRADEAEAERIRLEKLLADAANPLSRLKLRHSAACPFMFDGGCACGVKEVEALTRAALALEGEADDE